MKHVVIAATIFALGLIIAAFVMSGRYYFVRIDNCSVARGDRWTGEVETIRNDAGKGCSQWDF